MSGVFKTPSLMLAVLLKRVLSIYRKYRSLQLSVSFALQVQPVGYSICKRKAKRTSTTVRKVYGARAPTHVGSWTVHGKGLTFIERSVD